MINKCKYGALTTAPAGIRWGHVSSGMANPMDNDFVKIVQEGAKRTVGTPPSRQKEPMTVEMTKEVADSFDSGKNLLHKRTALICFLGFSGFLRISVLISIQVKQIQV